MYTRNMANKAAKTLLGTLLSAAVLHELGYRPHGIEHEPNEVFIEPLKIVEETLRHLPEQHFQTEPVRYAVEAVASTATVRSLDFLPLYAVSDASGTIVSNNSLLPTMR